MGGVLLEYGLTQPPEEALPFDAWFADHPEGRVYAIGVRFDGAMGRARYVPMPQDKRFVANVLATPAPNARAFCEETHEGGLLAIRAEWNEPIYPGVYSPMAVNARAVGPAARCAVTIRRREVRHRVLAPSRASTRALWSEVQAELARYAGFSAAHVRLDLTRLAAWERPANAAAAEHALLKFELGAFRATDHEALADLAALSALGAYDVLRAW